jgi:hypothetical protein
MAVVFFQRALLLFSNLGAVQITTELELEQTQTQMTQKWPQSLAIATEIFA